MKITISGDSHGSEMIGIIEGIPAGLLVDINKINEDLRKRKDVYGRGKRMKIEDDTAEIISGTWKNITTGAPLTIKIINKGTNTEKEIRRVPRPGHGDYSAYKRYGLDDLNIYTERNSARWTVVYTALGSVAKQFLDMFNIKAAGYVNSIGNIVSEVTNMNFNSVVEKRDISRVYCPDEKAELKMIKLIDEAVESGDTLGGSIRIITNNLPAGLGEYSDIFEKMDSKFSAYLMAIPSVKGVIIGNPDFTLSGRNYHDEFYSENNTIKRKTNNAGGIEAGITNGEELDIIVYLKPIPTLGNPLDSINLDTFEKVKAPYIRSDVTIVPAAVPVCESAAALVLTDALLKRYGNDNLSDIIKRLKK